MPSYNEYDYLHLTARVHAQEGRLLTRERLARMLDAPTAQEAARVLSECGYEELDLSTPTGLDAGLARTRRRVVEDLRKSAPDPRLVDFFAIKYDYHNAKVLLKAEAVGRAPGPLLVEGGRYPAALLQGDYARGDLRRLSEPFQTAILEAKALLSASGDPQRADFCLDRAHFSELTELAREVNSPFLAGYTALLIDSTNLRSAVRSIRMGRDAHFLRSGLLPGGGVDLLTLAEAAQGGDLAALFSHTPLREAAALGAPLRSGGRLTGFERACDNALMAYLSAARRTPFGEAPVVGYLCAREAELVAIRVVLSGKLAGLSADLLRERLRDTYV